MALETLTGTVYIDDLNSANPVGNTDPMSDVDAHIRGIKNTLKLSFPNVTGAVTATHTELNYVDGVTSQLSGNTQTATLTDKTLTAPVLNAAEIGSGGILFEGSTENAFETNLDVTDPTADRTVTIQDATHTLVGRDTPDILTNKTINGSQLVDSSIDGSKMTDVAVGDFITHAPCWDSITTTGTLVKKLEVKMGRDGAVKVRTLITHGNDGTGNVELRVYLNGSASGTLNTSSTADGSGDIYTDASITVSIGDLVQLYVKDTATPPTSIKVSIQVAGAAPMASDATNYTLMGDF